MINNVSPADPSNPIQASDSNMLSVVLTNELTKILDADTTRIRILLENRSANLCQMTHKPESTTFINLFPDTSWIDSEAAALEFWAKGQGELVIVVWGK